MGWPKTYELKYLFSKKEINLTANEVLNDIQKSLDRDGYSSQIVDNYIDFRSEPERNNLVSRFFTDKRSINLKCKIEYTENEKEISFVFNAITLNEYIKTWAVLAIFFTLASIGLINDLSSLIVGLIGGLASFTLLSLFVYYTTKSYLHDIVYYRLFWKFLNNNKPLRKSAESASNL